MGIGVLHDYLDQAHPDSLCFGISLQYLTSLTSDLIHQVGPQLGDVPIEQAGRVSFTGVIDAGSFDLDRNGKISLNLQIALHPRGDPASPIVKLVYEVRNVQMDALWDGGESKFVWVPDSLSSIALRPWAFEPGADAALVAAGYVDAGGNADREAFKEQMLYGFIWINARNLLLSICANMPFPQIQSWLHSIVPGAPMKTEISEGYLIIYSDELSLDHERCGEPTTSKPARPAKWNVTNQPRPAGDLSPFDAADLPLFVRYPGELLAQWEAGALEPTVHFSRSGGGWIRWQASATVSLTEIGIDLRPDQNGGTIGVTANFTIKGDSSAWLDGPSGKRISLISVSLKAKGDLKGELLISIDGPSQKIYADIDISVEIDRRSIDFGGGAPWPLSDIVAEIAEFLIRAGAIKIDTSYRHRAKGVLIDLSDFTNGRYGQAWRRVTETSALVGFTEREGFTLEFVDEVGDLSPPVEAAQ